MKITYKKFISSSRISEYGIYLILGKPYHLQNEVQSKIEQYYTNKEYMIKKIIVDSDFNLEAIKDDFENYSLFSENKFILFNVISNTIPKNLSEYLLERKSTPDLVILIKLSPQAPSFKKTKIYSKIDADGCVIEIHELTGLNLIEWMKMKFKKNNITYTEELFKKLIDKNEGNTSAISQELYKMSLLDINDVGIYFDFIQKEYKYSEFDLIDAIVDCNIHKALKIIDYLKSIKSPEVYILFLINSEIKKIHSLVCKLSPPPYIPNFKKIFMIDFLRIIIKNT
jgi:DNA polymerase III delta subunit